MTDPDHIMPPIPQDEGACRSGTGPSQAEPVPVSSLRASVPSAQFHDKPLSDLELSVRTSHCLKNAKVSTVGEVAAMTEAQILRVENFGRKSLNEIKEVLASMGLRLGMGSEPSPAPVDECTAAVQAGIVSVKTQWARGRKQKVPCRCRLCIRSRIFDNRVRMLGDTNRKYFSALYDDLCEIEDERDYLRAILDGSWPQSVEILQNRLAQAIEARSDETRSGSAVGESAVSEGNASYIQGPVVQEPGPLESGEGG